MILKKFTVENWRSIIHAEIAFKNLLIFIGENNSGKSSLISAILFFLNPINFNEENLKNLSSDLKICGEFLNSDNNEVITLKIFKFSQENKPIFLIEKNGYSKEINLKEYLLFLGDFPILNISSDYSVFEKFTYDFIFKMANFLKTSYPNSNIDDNFFKEKYNQLEQINFSKPSFRTLIFHLVRYFNQFIQENNITEIKKIFIILENPEIFLKPQEEREFYDCLIKLSNIGVNIIIETHSSRFVGLKQYPSIIIAKQKNNESTFFQFKGHLFSGDEIKNFNMNYWISTDRGELFFAKKVILVEGQTDKIIISYLAKLLKIFNYEYTIVECGSKSLIPQFIKLCNSFIIPYTAVYDKDNHLWRNNIELENSNKKNRQIQSSINYSIGKFVEFYNDIEEEIYATARDKKNYRNKPFNALKTVMEETYKIPLELENKIKKIFS